MLIPNFDVDAAMDCASFLELFTLTSVLECTPTERQLVRHTPSPNDWITPKLNIAQHLSVTTYMPTNVSSVQGLKRGYGQQISHLDSYYSITFLACP